MPAGAIVAVPVQLVQMDTSNWGHDANIFNPERFLKHKHLSSDSSEGQAAHAQKAAGVPEQKGINDVKDSHVEGTLFKFEDLNANPSFLPFGSGSRVCVGKKFAIVEMTALLASILQRYEIKLGPGSNLDPMPKIENYILHLFPSPKLRLVPRDS